MIYPEILMVRLLAANGQRGVGPAKGHWGLREKMIKFHTLGFTSKDQADAWLDLHVPQGDFGFVIDFHTLMVNVHHSITGVDSLMAFLTHPKSYISTIAHSSMSDPF